MCKQDEVLKYLAWGGDLADFEEETYPESELRHEEIMQQSFARMLDGLIP